MHVQLLVDAVQVFDGVVTEGSWAWTPSTDLADNSVHNVVALVTDAAGNTSGLIWSFSVVAPPPMYVGGSCTQAGCHEYYPAPHPVNNCEACHSYGDYFTGDHDSTGDPTRKWSVLPRLAVPPRLSRPVPEPLALGGGLGLHELPQHHVDLLGRAPGAPARRCRHHHHARQHHDRLLRPGLP